MKEVLEVVRRLLHCKLLACAWFVVQVAYLWPAIIRGDRLRFEGKGSLPELFFGFGGV
jgi:hypothetical protein